MNNGGGFLLYLQMHDNPTDLRAVLRDYAEDMVLPALEVYSNGLLTDSSMYGRLSQRKRIRSATTKEITMTATSRSD